ncbi:transcriptional regulator, TetR family [Saccharopolyspora kobensis]|uniref:Transcriptional regulator, TetR family n=1 Tax=Saccharopolyspora kobensis TaxID=146035 RepID=A0A1H6DNJ7_9PSEU|nr:TetR/AcrR family transcriptional regulator [Saccharopolyspora kobensis]SEG86818.1 transcriptional regulator, TetR family [Saccharopolyspora kobensis]SFF01331.1 transcriptional regulator, TetR family [Saccharopolyspora kobensis]
MSGRSQPATLVWMRDRERGSRPAMTEERIVRTAIDLADAEGIDALSMRRIASEMGSGTTSLYRHITNKDELIELMVDVVFGEIEPPAASDDWLAELADVARGFRRALLRHPWLAQQATRRPALGPNVIKSTDHALGVVGRATDDASRAAMIVGSINTFVLGSVAAELAELEAQRSTGMTEADWRDSVGDYVRQVVDSGRYPHFNRRILEADDRDYEARFEFGLGCLLGGIAAALT